MSAQDFCYEVQRQKIQIMDPISAIANAIKSKAKEKTTTKQLNQNTIESKVYSKAVSTCKNKTNISQKNSIDNSKCMKFLGCDITRVPKGMSPAMMSKWMDSKVKICKGFSGNNQENVSYGGVSDCVASSVVNQLSEAGLTAANIARIEKVLESKGLATETNSNTKSCSVIRGNVKSSAYVDAVSTCLNELGLSQENTMACSSASKQRNEIGKMYSKCVSDQLSNQTAKTTMDTSSDTSVSTKLKSDTASMSLSFSVIVFLVLMGIVFLKSSSGKKKIYD